MISFQSLCLSSRRVSSPMVLIVEIFRTLLKMINNQRASIVKLFMMFTKSNIDNLDHIIVSIERDIVFSLERINVYSNRMSAIVDQMIVTIELKIIRIRIRFTGYGWRRRIRLRVIIIRSTSKIIIFIVSRDYTERIVCNDEHHHHKTNVRDNLGNHLIQRLFEEEIEDE